MPEQPVSRLSDIDTSEMDPYDEGPPDDEILTIYVASDSSPEPVTGSLTLVRGRLR